jgi:hypothetical protein
MSDDDTLAAITVAENRVPVGLVATVSEIDDPQP